MTHTRSLKLAGVITAFSAIILAGMINNSRHVKARNDDDQSEESRIQRGFDIAPVHLNLEGKNRALVGLGSYIVNAQVDCNGCKKGGEGQAIWNFHHTKIVPLFSTITRHQSPITSHQAAHRHSLKQIRLLPYDAVPQRLELEPPHHGHAYLRVRQLRRFVGNLARLSSGFHQ